MNYYIEKVNYFMDEAKKSIIASRHIKKNKSKEKAQVFLGSEKQVKGKAPV